MRKIGQPMLAPPKRSGPWSARMVAELHDLKAYGLTFERAWDTALRNHPPRGRDLGEERPTLFAPGAEGELDPVEFLRRSCEDAWHNRRPALVHLVVPDRDGSSHARYVA